MFKAQVQDLFSVKTIQTLTSYHARIPFKFHEAILRVNFRPSVVLASGLTSVGNEVSVPSGRVSMVSSFLGGAFFPFPPLPFCTQVVERYSFYMHIKTRKWCNINKINMIKNNYAGFYI